MIVQKKRKKSIYPFFHKRHDFESALIVEEGIRLQSKAGTEFAEAYLRFRGIKAEVINRVLSDSPDKRSYVEND